MVGLQGDAPLVGREPELAVLRSVLTDAAAGRPGAVLVAAEAGGGKSRLVRALLSEPREAARLVLRAQCVDLGEPGLPYLAMVDLARALRGVATDDSDVAAVLSGFPVLADLATAADPGAPGAAEPSAAEPSAADSSRRLQLFDAMAAVLAEVGRTRAPVVVVVEDLQWVDSSSADFLRFLISRMGSEHLGVVATVRTDGLATRPGVRRLLSELGRLPAVTRLDLAPFDVAEVAELLAQATGDDPDPDVAADVLRRTGGNPYYVQTLAAAVTEAGGVDEGIPRALADLLVGRLDGLPADVQHLLRSAAVAGRTVTDRLLRDVAGLDDTAVDEAVRVAVAEGLLTTGGTGYTFAHDLLREAVYDDLLPGERARLHAIYGAALESGSGGAAAPAEVARHFVAAQDPAKALVWSVRAGEEAMGVLAPEEAYRHLERALAAWPDVVDPASVAGLSEGRLATRAATAAGLAGEPARAVEWAGRAVQLCDDGADGPAGVEARTVLARQLIEAGAEEQAVRPAEEAVRLTGTITVEPDATARAHVVLTRALLLCRRIDDARRQSTLALEAAGTAGVPAVEVEALTATAFLDEIEGDRQGSADRLGTALRLARAEGELAAELRAHYSLASLHYYNGDVAGSLPGLRAAMARVRESGLRWSVTGVELRLLLAVALFASGDLDGSLQAAEAPESPPPDVAAARLSAISCYPAVALGHPQTAHRLAGLRDSWDLDPQVALVAGGCEADHLTWEGDHAAAVVMAERAQVHLDDAVGPGMYGGLWLSAIGLAALADEAAACRQRRDDTGVAAALRQGDVLRTRVEELVTGGRGRPGDLGPEGRAWHARAVAEDARLRGDPAAEPWQHALEAFGYGHTYEQARCRWRLAEALVAVGDRAAARTHALAAAEDAERMGAVPLKRAVAATISRARLAGQADTDAVLTGREREVLALVAEGLTNREVGSRLFISEKTASVHLSNLMAKLNVSSRTEAVTVAQRRGLLDIG